MENICTPILNSITTQTLNKRGPHQLFGGWGWGRGFRCTIVKLFNPLPKHVTVVGCKNDGRAAMQNVLRLVFYDPLTYKKQKQQSRNPETK